MENESRKYYAAYEERYKTAHEQGVNWASDPKPPVVLEIMEKGITSALPEFDSLMYAVVQKQAKSHRFSCILQGFSCYFIPSFFHSITGDFYKKELFYSP